MLYGGLCRGCRTISESVPTAPVEKRRPLSITRLSHQHNRLFAPGLRDRLMPEQPDNDIKLPDPAEFAKNIVKIAAQSQRLVADFLKRQQADGAAGSADPLNIGSAFQEMTAKMMADPAKLVQAQLELWK